MRLVSYLGAAKKSSGGGDSRARTTLPGFVNRNGQVVVRKNGRASANFPGQQLYDLKCKGCSQEYAANGCDVHARRCPFCQGGAPGEVAAERERGLFS
jgi:hypothetical protein